MTVAPIAVDSTHGPVDPIGEQAMADAVSASEARRRQNSPEFSGIESWLNRWLELFPARTQRCCEGPWRHDDQES